MTRALGCISVYRVAALRTAIGKFVWTSCCTAIWTAHRGKKATAFLTEAGITGHFGPAAFAEEFSVLRTHSLFMEMR